MTGYAAGGVVDSGDSPLCRLVEHRSEDPAVALYEIEYTELVIKRCCWVGTQAWDIYLGNGHRCPEQCERCGRLLATREWPVLAWYEVTGTVYGDPSILHTPERCAEHRANPRPLWEPIDFGWQMLRGR